MLKFKEIKDAWICTCIDDDCKRKFVCPTSLTHSEAGRIILPCGHELGYHFKSDTPLTENETSKQKSIKVLESIMEDINITLNDIRYN